MKSKLGQLSIIAEWFAIVWINCAMNAATREFSIFAAQKPLTFLQVQVGPTNTIAAFTWNWACANKPC